MIRSGCIVLLFAILSGQTVAQDAAHRRLSDEQLLEALREHRSPVEYGVNADIPSGRHGMKCGFELSAEAVRRLETMQGEHLVALRKLLQPQVMDTSTVSPSGKFRIHFDLGGDAANRSASVDGNCVEP